MRVNGDLTIRGNLSSKFEHVTVSNIGSDQAETATGTDHEIATADFPTPPNGARKYMVNLNVGRYSKDTGDGPVTFKINLHDGTTPTTIQQADGSHENTATNEGECNMVGVVVQPDAGDHVQATFSFTVDGATVYSDGFQLSVIEVPGTEGDAESV